MNIDMNNDPMTFYVTKYTPIYRPETVQGRPVAFRSLPERSKVTVEVKDVAEVRTSAVSRICVLCTYNDGMRTPITGYIPLENIELYVEGFPSGQVQFDNQTPSTIDAEQYVLYHGDTEYNLCGQACLAYALNISLTEVLDRWEAKEPTWWGTFFNRKGSARGTSDGELLRLSIGLGRDAETLISAMRFSEGRDVRYTPARLQRLLERGPVIASVNVDGAYFYVRGAGILHWVVVTEVVAERDYGGYVKFWNSLTNSVQLCSWREWIASARSPYGIVIG